MNITILCHCEKGQILNYSVGEIRHFDKCVKKIRKNGWINKKKKSLTLAICRGPTREIF